MAARSGQMPQWRGRQERDRESTRAQAVGPFPKMSPRREAHQAGRTALPRTWAAFPGPCLPMFQSANRRPARRQTGPRRSRPVRRRNLAVTTWRSAVEMNSIGASLTLEFTMAMPITSACDHHFLIKAAEERFFADANAAAGKPFGDFVTPQIERKGFQFGQQRPPNVAHRMPPPRQIIIHNDDLSTWLYDTKKLAERSLAILAGLLMQ